MPLCLSLPVRKSLTNKDARKSAIFSVLDCKYPFLGKFDPKNKKCQFKLKFGTQTNSNMHNSMRMLTFPVFDRKYSFWANLVPKFKIVSLKIVSVTFLLVCFLDLKESTCKTRRMVFILLQKFYSFLRKSSFRTLDIQTS